MQKFTILSKSLRDPTIALGRLEINVLSDHKVFLLNIFLANNSEPREMMVERALDDLLRQQVGLGHGVSARLNLGLRNSALLLSLCKNSQRSQ